jgi:hypothetical protein
MPPQGWALAAQGYREEGIAQIHQSLASHRAIGTELARTYHLALLAEVDGSGGQTREGLRVLAEAMAVMDKNGERYSAAELYRLKGKLLLRQTIPDKQQAETCFVQALAVARRQQAKSLDVHFTSPAPVYGLLGARASSPLLKQAGRLRSQGTGSAFTKQTSSVQELREAIAVGEVIEDYPTDKYGPSCLVLPHTIRCP